MGDDNEVDPCEGICETFLETKKKMLLEKKKLLELKLKQVHAGTHPTLVEKLKALDTKHKAAIKAAVDVRKHKVHFFRLWIAREREGLINTHKDEVTTLRERIAQKKADHIENLRQQHLDMLLLPEPIRESDFVAWKKTETNQEDNSTSSRPVRTLPRRAAQSGAAAATAALTQKDTRTTANAEPSADGGAASATATTTATTTTTTAAAAVEVTAAAKRRGSEPVGKKKKEKKKRREEEEAERSKEKKGRGDAKTRTRTSAADGSPSKRPKVHVGPCVVYMLRDDDIAADLKALRS
ncbi:hypothetical protein PTSG_01629 [Salpingoeca rosetta]|uniref:Uncharacterized protein n=1 Tax=Salpingoeca rosetta (strain ATCC 50818 / BSB-021) TaxID=946362 RepID=F2TYH7_SALR5|nr:uncharacterized protein PTSG_01629 [Salpingoeca rosetta]EGD78651.1 hypothetical protein PTSG_01629 [Salpingoeca rosetta]|eukprot:XP_004997609.1 hypothetical protein PTSG_01629 [Salpingoeca rosetta]